MDRERGEIVQSSELPRTGPRRNCKKCGTPIQERAAFCAKCGADAPAGPLSFDSLPDSWKKAAVGLLGVTVLGVLISALWPSGEAGAPAEPEVESPSSSDAATTPPSRLAAPRPIRPKASEQEPPSPTGEWNVRVESSPLDDIKTVFLDLKAMDSPEVKGTSSYAPQMSFLCTERNVEGYIFVRSPPQVGRSRYATTRIRFDEEEPQTLHMDPSEKKDALFFDKPASILKQMLGRKRMLFGYTPQGAEEVVTSFDLRGVEEAVKPFVEGCDVPELTPEDQQADTKPTKGS